ncbi:hypothetical protein ACIXQB_10770 [Bacteroides fragilis]
MAVNRALKKIKGDCLVWPDSDDFYATMMLYLNGRFIDGK